MTPEEVDTKVAEARADLVMHGYEEVPEAYDVTGRRGRRADYDWRPGVRVRHIGQQWAEARDKGTATVRVVMHKPNSPWTQTYGQADIEIIVVRDRESDLLVKVANWAHYHTVRAYDQTTPVEVSDV